MAYSLKHNQQFIYYDRTLNNNDVVRELASRDHAQLMRSSRALLKNAECWKKQDRSFIETTLDRNFDSREDAVAAIKVFVESRLQGARATGTMNAMASVGGTQTRPGYAARFLDRRSTGGIRLGTSNADASYGVEMTDYIEMKDE